MIINDKIEGKVQIISFVDQIGTGYRICSRIIWRIAGLMGASPDE